LTRNKENLDCDLIQKSMDKNFSKNVDYEEFRKAILTSGSKVSGLLTTIRRLNKHHQFNVEKIFKEFDIDNDQTLSYKEFKEYIKKIGFRINFDETESLFDHLNFEKNGKLAKLDIMSLFSDQLSQVNKIQTLEDFKNDVANLDLVHAK
jgi:Ca2+-binding EF-hand superfamily protein